MKQLIKESNKRVKKYRKEVDNNSKEVKAAIKKLGYKEWSTFGVM